MYFNLAAISSKKIRKFCLCISYKPAQDLYLNYALKAFISRYFTIYLKLPSCSNFPHNSGIIFDDDFLPESEVIFQADFVKKENKL